MTEAKELDALAREAATDFFKSCGIPSDRCDRMSLEASFRPFLQRAYAAGVKAAADLCDSQGHVEGNLAATLIRINLIESETK